MDGSSTPGPWVVEDGWLQREAGPLVDGRYLSVCVTATDIRDIALMTAAPDLLSTLVGLEASMAAILESDLRRAGPAALIPEWLAEIRAAISKATSRQPEGER